MKLLKRALAAPIAAAMMAFSIPASAATQSWVLDVWGGSGSQTGPLATVTVTDNGPLGTSATVNVQLTAPVVGFVNTGNHTPFAFNLNDAPDSITFNVPPGASGFTVGSPPPFPDPSFGDFAYGIFCSSCGAGGSNPNPGPLNFTITDADGINVNSFIGNAGGWVFAADILVRGATGAVSTNTPAIPEPETYAMMLVGFGLLGFVARRRRQAFGNVVPA